MSFFRGVKVRVDEKWTWGRGGAKKAENGWTTRPLYTVSKDFYAQNQPLSSNLFSGNIIMLEAANPVKCKAWFTLNPSKWMQQLAVPSVSVSRLSTYNDVLVKNDWPFNDFRSNDYLCHVSWWLHKGCFVCISRCLCNFMTPSSEKDKPSGNIILYSDWNGTL